MRSSTGRWVSGDNFFDRERELQILETEGLRPQSRIIDWSAAHGEDQCRPGTRATPRG